MQFAITGVAGYVARRHLEAIKVTGNELVAAMDPHDSVGVIDSYFPSTKFFTEVERFDRHLEKLKRKGPKERVDFLSICSPNYFHDSHARMGLRVGANVICEKPLVVSPWNLDQLIEVEKEYGKKVYCVLQLRYHPNIIALKKKVEGSGRKNYNILLSYVTPRGSWYNSSWKGNPRKSGGIAMNIGIHFFDMLMWIFGAVEHSDSGHRSENTAEGILTLEKATVRWLLTTEIQYSKTGYPERSLRIDEEEFDFSSGFEDLHTKVYEDILSGGGYGIEDCRASIDLTHRIRTESGIGN
jgi:UDP-N-acetyl-2-amino-2-deoxyglucuronate dehydrogenase